MIHPQTPTPHHPAQPPGQRKHRPHSLLSRSASRPERLLNLDPSQTREVAAPKHQELRGADPTVLAGVDDHQEHPGQRAHDGRCHGWVTDQGADRTDTRLPPTTREHQQPRLSRYLTPRDRSTTNNHEHPQFGWHAATWTRHRTLCGYQGSYLERLA
jgi:hypothetical protein